MFLGGLVAVAVRYCLNMSSGQVKLGVLVLVLSGKGEMRGSSPELL